MGGLVILYFSSYFTVQIVELDDKYYNILLIDNKHNRIEYRLKSEPKFHEGDTVRMNIKAECQKSFQCHEEDGPNAKWAEGQNWVVDAPAYICTALEIQNEKISNLD